MIADATLGIVFRFSIVLTLFNMIGVFTGFPFFNSSAIFIDEVINSSPILHFWLGGKVAKNMISKIQSVL